MEALDKYIETHGMVPGKESIPTITNVRGRKRDDSVNLVGDPNKNPILDTRIYELELQMDV